MTKDKKKSEVIISPRGVAAYSWLLRPDEAFGQNKFKLTLLLEKEAKENAEFVKDLKKRHAEATTHDTESPIKDGDEGDKEDFRGHWWFTCKSNFKPKIVDSKRKELSEDDPTPMSGDIVKVAMKCPPYDTGNRSGVSLQLVAVQLLDKRHTSNLSSLFGDEEGFIADSDDQHEAEEDF